MKVAIITGASSGLGRTFAAEIDRRGLVDEIWAVARRENRLDELAASLHTPVRKITLDLAQGDSTAVIASLLAEELPDVRVLVNAAGFGKIGNYSDLTQAENDGMIDVNIRALVNVTVAVLPYMSRGGRLFQIASSASFQPLPGLNVYAASKAFVLRYTRALRWELHGRGILVTAVCPGWIKTEFISVAQDTKNRRAVRKFPLMLKPETVVKASFAANSAHLAVATCAPHTLIQRLGTKIVPDWVSMAFWGLVR